MREPEGKAAVSGDTQRDWRARVARQMKDVLSLGILVTLVILAVTTILYLRNAAEKRELSIQRYRRAFDTFSNQTEQVLKTVLETFRAHTSQPSLPALTSPTTSTVFKIDERAIEASSATYPTTRTGDCPLRLDGSTLTYRYVNFVQNSSGQTWENWDMRLSSDLRNQLEPYAAHPERRSFLTLLVASEDGSTLLRQGGNEIGLTKRQIAAWIDRKGDGGRNTGEGPDAMDEIPIQWNRYRVLHREVPLFELAEARPLLEKQLCPRDALHLFGVVDEEKVQSESLTLPRGPLIIVCFVVFLGLLSLPFMKLFLAQEHERFRRVDVALLLFCGSLAVATMVFSAVFAASLNLLQRKNELFMKAYAHGLSGKLAQDTESLLEKGASANTNPDKNAPPPLPDEREKEISKLLTVGNRFTPFTHWATGERWTAFLARPEEPEKLLMVHLSSLESTKPPGNLEFAVLDRDAEVLYHSDRWRAGFENFVTAGDGARSLQVALQVRSGKPFTAPYEGRQYRMLAIPTAIPSWTLVVFHSLEPFRSIRLYASLFTMAAVCVYVLLMTAALAALRLWFGTSMSLVAYGPDPQRGPLYLVLAGVYLVVGIGCFAMLSLLSPARALLASVLVPALAFLSTLQVITLWRRDRLFGRGTGTSRRTTRIVQEKAYPLAVTVVLLLVVGLPTFASFRFAFERELWLFAEHSHRALLTGKGDPSPGLDRLYTKFRLLDNDYTNQTNGVLYRGAVPRATSSVGWLLPGGFLPRLGCLALLGIGIAAIAGVTTLTVRTLFSAATAAPEIDPERLGAERVVWTAPEPERWQAFLSRVLGVRTMDLSDLLSRSDQKIARIYARTLLIPDFATGEDAQRRQAVEKLLRSWQGGIWLTSSIGLETDQALQELLDIGSFRNVHPALTEWNAEGALTTVPPEDVWKTLTIEEQDVCMNVAEGRFLRLAGAAAVLRRYGILKDPPAPRLFSSAFAVHARREARSSRVRVPEPPPRPGRWSVTRNVAIIVLIVFFLFLQLTQEESFKTLSAAITGLAALLGALWEIGGRFKLQTPGGST